MVERMIRTDGVEICTEAFGDPGDPAMLLIAGLGSSMFWWDEDLCRMLAEGGRFVIRYDHRDTGRSTTYEPGRPGYTGGDLVADAAGVLDAYEIPAAHVVGVSAGGALAQMFALDHPRRVASLVLISTSLALSGDRALPPPTEEFTRFVSTARADRPDRESLVEYLVEYSRVLAGGVRPFDETRIRRLVRLEADRADDFAARRNHDLISDDGRRRPALSSIAAPTLVIHGTADPMFPIAHGEALAEEIPGARLLRLKDAGHGVDPADWKAIVHAIIDHTAAT